jgi:glucose/arabinose dehydrogenase
MGHNLRRARPKRFWLFLLTAIAVSTSGAVFVAAPKITSSWWWRTHVTHPECAGADATVSRSVLALDPPQLLATGVATGLQTPTSLAAMPNGNLLITEKPGVLTILNLVDGSRATVADLKSIVKSSDDNGLISVVVHPNYGVDGEERIFLFYNELPDSSIVVASAKLNSSQRILPDDLTTLQKFPHVSTSHSGGAMVFLSDDELLVSTGDDMKGSNSQSEEIFLGKMLTIDPDVPGQQPVVIALGLRNPVHVTLSPNKDTLWVADVGSNCVEEVNRIPLTGESTSVTNFGWPFYEGELVLKKKSTLVDDSSLTAPIYTYAHEKGVCAVIGGAFLANWYIFADYCDGSIRGLPLDAAPKTKAAKLLNLNGLGKRVGIVAISGDELGRVWVLDGWGGTIYRLEATP